MTFGRLTTMTRLETNGEGNCQFVFGEIGVVASFLAADCPGFLVSAGIGQFGRRVQEVDV